MYYVNIKINKKNTISLAKRIVTFLHCSFPAIVFGREGYGCGTSRWVGCDSDCFLSLFTLDSNQHNFYTRTRLKKSEKSDFDLHLDEGMEQVRTGTSFGG